MTDDSLAKEHPAGGPGVGDVDGVGDVAMAESRVRERGAVAVAELTEGLSRDAGALLVDALVHRGLEKSAKVVRVPVGEQLTMLIRREGEVPLTGIDKRVAGASGPEVKRAVSALAAAGEVALNKRGRSEQVLWAEGRVADAAQIERAAESVAALKNLVKELEKRVGGKGKAKPKYALLRDELESWRERVRDAVSGPAPSLPAEAKPAAEVAPEPPAASPPAEGKRAVGAGVAPARPAAAPAPKADDVAERILRTLATFDRDPLLHLVYLPDLVRALGRSGVGVAAVHATLLDAVDAGHIELRHESDPERLSAADRALCLTAPSGRLMSYVRVGPA